MWKIIKCWELSFVVQYFFLMAQTLDLMGEMENINMTLPLRKQQRLP